MKEIQIYEPAMCCSTGLCGVSINQELLRVSTIINTLSNKGFKIVRYNLSANPEAFLQNTKVNKYLNDNGAEILPITLLSGEIIKTKNYPTNIEFEAMLGVKLDIRGSINRSCNCNGGNC